MSLLMDALKKAELAKRQGNGSNPESATKSADSGNIALEPLNSEPANAPQAEPTLAHDAAAGSALPDLPLHLEQLDAEFLTDAQQRAQQQRSPQAHRLGPSPAEATATATRPPQAQKTGEKLRQQPDQAAARNVFAAKQPSPSGSRFGLVLGGLTLLAVAGIGGYFWWQLQPKSGLAANPALQTMSLPPAPAVTSYATTTAPLSGQGEPQTMAPTAGSKAMPAPAAHDEDDEVDTHSSPLTASQAGSRRAAPVQHNPRPGDSSEEPIRLTRSPPRVDPTLTRGFDAFTRGDLGAARSEYERALKTDPKNSDALHGLAAIALRQGQVEQAAWLYQQIIEANPQDAAAQAALINLAGQTDPVAAESRLKNLAANRPELATPHFALGNLYARQGRWSEAQAAYFQAWNAEPENPDIPYNLAISLEHLRQSRLAAEYYSQALRLANTRPASFDKLQAESRLRALQP